MSRSCSIRRQQIPRVEWRGDRASLGRQPSFRVAVALTVMAIALTAASSLALTKSDDAVMASQNDSTGQGVFNVAEAPIVRRGCWVLLSRARFGFSRVEYAAFVVRNPQGSLWVYEWPEPNVSDSAAWMGAFPRGTVGIVHTHPNWRPDPSAHDVRTARVSRVPVYVITRTRITATDGETIRVVAEGDWELTGARHNPSAPSMALGSDVPGHK